MLTLINTQPSSRIDDLLNMIMVDLNEVDDVHLTQNLVYDYVYDQLAYAFNTDPDPSATKLRLFIINATWEDDEKYVKSLKLLPYEPHFTPNPDFIATLLMDVDLNAIKGVKLKRLPEDSEWVFPFVMVYL